MFKNLKNYFNNYKNNKIQRSRTTRALYSTDISIYEILPYEVFWPKNTKDVAKIINYAIKNKITIHARGSGTSVAGQSLGHGAILDFSRFMNKIIEIAENYVDIEPGLIHDNLNKILKKHGKFFPPDPSSSELCTIGGMLANNASGLHSYMYGDVRQYVLGLEGYWPDGSFFSTIKNIGTEQYKEQLLKIHNEAISLIKYLPKTEKDSSGYNIKNTFKINNNKKLIDINSLLTGSEGTLAIITKIRLKIIKLPEQRLTILAQFDSIEKSIEALLISRNHLNVSAIELLDSELISISRENFKELRDYFTDTTQAGLIIELDGSETALLENANLLVENLSKLCLQIELATEEEKRKKIWWMRKAANPILSRTKDSTCSLRIIDDMAVPIDSILEFYIEQKKILNFYKLKTAFFGHVGSAHFHINPLIDTRNPNYYNIISTICDKSYTLIKKLNGTFSAEHGDGILRASAIKKFNPELCNFYIKIKKIFDPNELFNPGKIIPASNLSQNFTDNNRYAFVPVQCVTEQLLCSIEKCHGCNHCLHFCDSYLEKEKQNKSNITEAYKTRGRANMLRAVLNGNLKNNQIRIYLDSCKQCGHCLKKCPSGIDMIKIASKVRQEKIISVTTKKQLLMLLLFFYKIFFEFKLKRKKNINIFIKNNFFLNILATLFLYYKPYGNKMLRIIKSNNLNVRSDNTKLKLFLEKYVS